VSCSSTGKKTKNETACIYDVSTYPRPGDGVVQRPVAVAPRHELNARTASKAVLPSMISRGE
jgi:hypothetical protein